MAGLSRSITAVIHYITLLYFQISHHLLLKMFQGLCVLGMVIIVMVVWGLVLLSTEIAVGCKEGAEEDGLEMV